MNPVDLVAYAQALIAAGAMAGDVLSVVRQVCTRHGLDAESIVQNVLASVHSDADAAIDRRLG